MDDKELDAQIAQKVMGWKKAIVGVHLIQKVNDVLGPHFLDGNALMPLPKYSTDLNACREAEMKLSSKQKLEYAFELEYPDDVMEEEARHHQVSCRVLYDVLFAVMTKTARQRCEAMLKVVGDE